MANDQLTIRQLAKEDCSIISQAFTEQGWDKRTAQYESYLEEQSGGKRDILVAKYNGEFAGYLTIKWESCYRPFQEKSIPEIVDLNVLIKFQRKGIATKLMEEAEKSVSKRSPVIGIGFGLTKDYGAAQKLYINRGYLPDGLGISQRGEFLEYEDKVVVDDDLALYLTKSLV